MMVLISVLTALTYAGTIQLNQFIQKSEHDKRINKITSTQQCCGQITGLLLEKWQLISKRETGNAQTQLKVKKS